ncbi:hypothetical protein PIB30_017491 [Stylosanthes scabra]|uniref:Uncharacterized protein n=1 Tax=Stylosanthes scabra TaxID=79078 RepID=A0ABU6Q8J2_9FABA|nr:hypothetical protein [Stylosanthes scabra]
MIHEWITLRVEDNVFEVFAKEFGSEMYSVESHPNREEVSTTSMTKEGKLNSVSVVDESPVLSGESPVNQEFNNSNLVTAEDPLIESTINGKLTMGRDLREQIKERGVENVEHSKGNVIQNEVSSLGYKTIEANVGLDFGPMRIEAQLGYSDSNKETMNMNFCNHGPSTKA